MAIDSTPDGTRRAGARSEGNGRKKPTRRRTTKSKTAARTDTSSSEETLWQTETAIDAAAQQVDVVEVARAANVEKDSTSGNKKVPRTSRIRSSKRRKHSGESNEQSDTSALPVVQDELDREIITTIAPPERRTDFVTEIPIPPLDLRVQPEAQPKPTNRRRRRRRRGDVDGRVPPAVAPARIDRSGRPQLKEEDTSARGPTSRGPHQKQGRRRTPRDGRRPRSEQHPPTDIVPAPEVLDDGEDAGAIGAPEITRFVSRVAPGRGAQTGPTRELIINVSGGDECRIAVLQEARLEELFIERKSTESHVGNIYKGRIVNVEPSIQAVFVDFGLPKHGFLHISDVQPQYFPDHDGDIEEVGRKTPRHHRPPIQRCFRRGQEVIVQITKEGVGTKGPTLTTYLSIPGRYLVMMPGMSRHGVSRKIEDEVARRKMRTIMDELKLPSGMGFILRTAGLDRTKRDLQRDLQYLMRLWKTVVERVQQAPSPAELYRESDLVTRTIRDVYTVEFSRIVVDDAATAQKVLEFLQIAVPRTKTIVELYLEREPIFHRFGIEEEIDRINQRHVPLKSGGSLVIDSTEAMVAIDVNSGRFRVPDDAEETAFRLNIEAAEEIARQLRLRDLGGLIVCDFIDMRLDRHKRAVERALRDALKKHKERARILRMSAFGLIELTRQRQGPSIKRNIYFDCAHCQGTGHVKMPESVMLDVMRLVQLAAHQEQVQKISCIVATDVAYQLLNSKRAAITEIEAETRKTVIIRGDASFTSDQIDLNCTDGRGQLIALPIIRVADGALDRKARGWGKSRPAASELPEINDDEVD